MQSMGSVLEDTYINFFPCNPCIRDGPSLGAMMAASNLERRQYCGRRGGGRPGRRCIVARTVLRGKQAGGGCWGSLCPPFECERAFRCRRRSERGEGAGGAGRKRVQIPAIGEAVPARDPPRRRAGRRDRLYRSTESRGPSGRSRCWNGGGHAFRRWRNVTTKACGGGCWRAGDLRRKS